MDMFASFPLLALNIKQWTCFLERTISNEDPPCQNSRNSQVDVTFLEESLARGGWLSGWVAAFSSGRDPGIQDQVLHQAPCMEPASPSACVSASFFLCISHE